MGWELTMKCNLDCSYCSKGIYGGHDNTSNHPPLEECLRTIDFLLQYADLYMQHKTKGLRSVVLDVYGGESLHHPDITEILAAVRNRYNKGYQHKWHLTLTTTTNAVVSPKKMARIIELIDEFTVSYHTESSKKQKDTVCNNILAISSAGKRVKCLILMHARPDLFTDAQQMIAWCEANNIRYLPKQIDHSESKTNFNHSSQQIKWFENLYQQKSYKVEHMTHLDQSKQTNDLSAMGRACCGGRNLCTNQSYKQRHYFVANRFPDWFCSVNEFFVYIKQVTGEIFTNKDCKMNYDGAVGPIGNLSDSKSLLSWTAENLDNDSMPVIQCKNKICYCGLCAPKAKEKKEFDYIMEKYRT